MTTTTASLTAPQRVRGDGILHDEYWATASYRGRLIGLEVELYVVDRETLEPRDCLDTLGRHSGFGSAVHPEIVREQIEIRTDPSWSIRTLEDQLRALCVEATTLLAPEGAALLPAALLDVEGFTWSDDPRVAVLLEHLGPPFQAAAPIIAADQVNIGAVDQREACRILERAQEMLPGFAGLSAASPLRHGSPNGIACNRLDIYDSATLLAPGLARSAPRMDTLADYARFLESQPLFQHPNTSYAYVRPMPQRGTAAEIRCIDKQPRLADTLAFAALGKALVLSLDGLDYSAALPGATLTAARRHGVWDAATAGCWLDRLRTLLDAEERHYLDPLFARVSGRTPTTSMTEQFSTSGVRAVWRRLIDEFERELHG